MRRNTYEELERIVKAHQDGDKEATLQLIESFRLYIHKFINLIRHGKINLDDRQLREFVGLFVHKSIRSTFHRYKRDLTARQHIYRTVGYIQEIFRPYPVQELEHEGIVTLLALAQRYQSRGNFFHLYVLRSFHYQYYRRLQLLLDGPTFITLSGGRLPYWDEVAATCDFPDMLEQIEKEKSPYLICEPEDEINENWINGLTSSELFAELTPMQRKILKLYYLDDYTDNEIALLLGVCRATVNRRRLKAVRILYEKLKEQKMLRQMNHETTEKRDADENPFECYPS